MAFFIVNKRNPYFKTGTWVQSFDDGVQKVEIETVNNRVRAVRNVGLLIPYSEISPFMMRVQNAGLDKPGLRKYNQRYRPSR